MKRNHILVWALIFLFPVIVSSLVLGQNMPAVAIKAYFASIILFLVIFYTNYLFLIDRFLFKKKTWQFVALNICLLIATEFISRLVHYFLIGPPGMGLTMRHMVDSGPVRFGIISGRLLSQVLVVMISISLKGTNRVLEEQKRLQALEKEKIEAELKNLKDKLNPHFLFNALNNIYALTEYDSAKAQSAIESLSKLLRYVLYENDDDMVPLKEELDFTRCYIELMALRIDPANTALDLEIAEPGGGSGRIAPLMLMTLIENAFKHGVSAREKSFIRISIGTGEGKDGGAILNCVVANSLFPKSSSDKSGSGIGLDNLRKRLDILYKDEYVYTADISDNEYRVLLEVPLKH